MVNLLSNAIKYAPGQPIHVKVHQCPLEEALMDARCAGSSDLKIMGNESVDLPVENADKIVTVVSVRDHGRGIPPAEMASLFCEFVQLKVSEEMDRSKASHGSGMHHVGQTSGTGLGLSLVLKFVTKMNGHIWAANHNEGGAIFSFCFEAADDCSIRAPSRPASSGNLIQHAINTGSIKVMVVDDSSKYSLKAVD